MDSKGLEKNVPNAAKGTSWDGHHVEHEYVGPKGLYPCFTIDPIVQNGSVLAHWCYYLLWAFASAWGFSGEWLVYSVAFYPTKSCTVFMGWMCLQVWFMKLKVTSLEWIFEDETIKQEKGVELSEGARCIPKDSWKLYWNINQWWYRYFTFCSVIAQNYSILKYLTIITIISSLQFL